MTEVSMLVVIVIIQKDTKIFQLPHQFTKSNINDKNYEINE